MFDPAFPIAKLKGADYNPREISPGALERLEQSLNFLGVVKPIIVNGDVIVAGHQRTQALRRLGVKSAPVYKLASELTKPDEVRFNQMHNGTDLDVGDERVTVGPAADVGYEYVAAKAIAGAERASGANIRAAMCGLIARYGNWGACVATVSGEVIHAPQYALACRAMGIAARVFRIPDRKRDQALEYLNQPYGQFSYAHLPKDTFVQTFAQPYRLRENAKTSNLSELYEKYVIPSLRPGERILDFGCGQADYVKKLKKAGHDIIGVEFFFRSKRALDAGAVHAMIDVMCDSLATKGRFDMVIADSVLNSVDSLRAEADVLDCLNALCRPGGRAFFSGRSRTRFQALNKTKVWNNNPKETTVVFIDDDGFSGLYASSLHAANYWMYQKYCTKEEVNRLVDRHFRGCGSYVKYDNQRWRAIIQKKCDRSIGELAAALTREFDLPWPQGRSVGRSDQILRAYALALVVEQAARLERALANGGVIPVFGDAKLKIATVGER